MDREGIPDARLSTASEMRKPAGPPEVDGVVHLVLDLKQDVQHHGAAAAENTLAGMS